MRSSRIPPFICLCDEEQARPARQKISKIRRVARGTVCPGAQSRIYKERSQDLCRGLGYLSISMVHAISLHGYRYVLASNAGSAFALFLPPTFFSFFSLFPASAFFSSTLTFPRDSNFKIHPDLFRLRDRGMGTESSTLPRKGFIALYYIFYKSPLTLRLPTYRNKQLNLLCANDDDRCRANSRI